MSQPWETEPDRVEFEAHGFPCLIIRFDGHLCGYVAVPSGHPWCNTNYDHLDVEVHGGLTYTRACQGEVCHVPKPGESDDVRWFGFDAGHSDDYIPGRTFNRAPPENYRTIEYMRMQCEHLAKQAMLAGRGYLAPKDRK